MPGFASACPTCRQPLAIPQALPAQICCHQCGTGLWAMPDGTLHPQTPIDSGPVCVDGPIGGATVRCHESRDLPRPQPREAHRPRRNNGLIVGGIALGGVLFLMTSIGLLVLCFKASDRKPKTAAVEYALEPVTEEAPPAPRPPTPRPPADLPSEEIAVALAKAGPLHDDEPVASGKWGASPRPSVKLAGPGHSHVDESQVNEAIARGIAYLKNAGDYRSYIVGAQALSGLTLLSCGVPVDDPAVRRAIGAVRSGANGVRNTYEISLCVLFLDRVGAAGDGDLIRKLALRLIAGQGILGGWDYACPYLDGDGEKELQALLQAPPSAKPASMLARPKLVTPAFIRTDAKRNFKELPVFDFQPGTRLVYRPHPREDNSLTQFAILALWSAQKHGVLASRSLAMAEARFRASQAGDGSWGYTWRDAARCKYSMTCAGLLGLAAGRGSQARHDEAVGKVLEGDPAINKALRFLSHEIGADRLEKWFKFKTPGTYDDNGSGWGGYYFLWSVERVAVVYDLRTIGGKDWYAWGAPLILDTQKADGSWQDAFAGIPDTCFALLFLKRANVVRDLTQSIKFLTMSKDVGVHMREREPGTERSHGRRSEMSGSAAPGRVRGRKED